MVVSKYSNVRLERVTITRLKEVGKKSETFDMIINRLIDNL